VVNRVLKVIVVILVKLVEMDAMGMILINE
jgi:hypothetical protein